MMIYQQIHSIYGFNEIETVSESLEVICPTSLPVEKSKKRSLLKRTPSGKLTELGKIAILNGTTHYQCPCSIANGEFTKWIQMVALSSSLHNACSIIAEPRHFQHHFHESSWHSMTKPPRGFSWSPIDGKIVRLVVRIKLM